MAKGALGFKIAKNPSQRLTTNDQRLRPARNQRPAARSCPQKAKDKRPKTKTRQKPEAVPKDQRQTTKDQCLPEA